MEGKIDDSKAEFPMSVEEFLDGDHLERSDIILKCGDNLFSKAIRFATRSPFSHVAIVFLIPKRDIGFTHTYLIDATPSGVRVGKFASIVSAHQVKQGVGTAILRFERPWFNKSLQRRVRGHILTYVRSGYDWLLIVRLAFSMAKAVFFGPNHYTALFCKTLQRSHRKGKLLPASFICSGLILYGFLRAVCDVSKEPGSAVPERAKRSAIFNPNLTEFEPDKFLDGNSDAHAALLATTPDEISRSEHLSWKYVITKGLVYEVTSREEAIQKLHSKSFPVNQRND